MDFKKFSRQTGLSMQRGHPPGSLRFDCNIFP